MRNTFLLVVGLALLLVAAAGAQVEKAKGADEPAAPAAAAESIAFMKDLVQRMESPDARVRFAVREALVVMNRQALPVLNEHKASTQNEHLKAFIDRTIARIKSMQTRAGRSWSTMRGRDLDRLAMDCNLTLEQISQIQPILAKHDKNMQDLWNEFRESGAYRDKEAYKDLQDERKLMVEEAEPGLRKYLNDAQTKAVMEHLRTGSGAGPAMGGGVRIMGGPGGGVTIIRPGGQGEKGK
jgi:hypothetical protein